MSLRAIPISGVCVVATFGFVPFFFSSSSEIPSLSSSVSVTSGSPSPSVSRWIITGTSTRISSSPFFTLTGMFTLRSSSLPQLGTLGVPVNLPSLSTLNPLTGFSVVIVEPSLFGVTTFGNVEGTCVFSVTLVGSETFAVRLFAFFGSVPFAFSTSSGIPSLSSSLSVTSGSPSPSVSRWIVTVTVFSITSVTSSLPFSVNFSKTLVTLTGISIVRSSSSLPQLFTVGLPSSSPLSLTFRPFTCPVPSVGFVTIVEPSLFGVTTFVGVTEIFSLTLSGFVTTTSKSFTAFGSVPFCSSTVSGIPSLSSSVSSESGMPSPSVSRWIITGTFTIVSFPPFVTLTGIKILRSSSSFFQSFTAGVPSSLPSLLTFKPFTDPSGLSVVIVEFGIFGVTTVVGVTGLFSLTLVGEATIAVRLSGTFGFVLFLFSTSSGIPSLSSSVSKTSGIPSPSVSRWIVTGTSTLTVSVTVSLPFAVTFSTSFVTVTGIVIFFSSSLPQSSTVGVPVNLPSPLTVRPFTFPELSVVVVVIVAPFLFGVTTSFGVTSFFSSTTFGFVTATFRPSATFGFVPFLFSSSSEMPSLSSSGSSTSAIPSPSVSRWIVTGTCTVTSSFSLVILTGIVILRSSSPPFQLLTVGVPSNLPSPLTVKPFSGVDGSIVASDLFGVTTFGKGVGTGVFSFTLAGAVTIPVRPFATFGSVPFLFSSSSEMPSLSSSVSVTSGVPSPSVSRWILTGTLTLTSSESFLTFTGIVISRSSSPSPHLPTVGLPVNLPLLSTLKPFTGSGVSIVEFSLFGFTTSGILTSLFSITVDGLTTPVRPYDVGFSGVSGVFGSVPFFFSSSSVIPSPSSSGSVVSGSPSPSVSRRIVTGTFTVISSLPFLTLTGIVIARFSSSLPQLSTVGFPVKFPLLSTVNPFTSPGVVIVEPSLFGVTTFLDSTARFSKTSFCFVTSAVKFVGTVIFTLTLSVVWSGYSTTTTAETVCPPWLVSGVVNQRYFVPSGKSCLFPILSAASGVEFLGTVRFIPTGLYLSFCPLTTISIVFSALLSFLS